MVEQLDRVLTTLQPGLHSAASASQVLIGQLLASIALGGTLEESLIVNAFSFWVPQLIQQ